MSLPLSEHCQPFHSSKFAATLSFYIDVHVCNVPFFSEEQNGAGGREEREETKKQKREGSEGGVKQFPVVACVSESAFLSMFLSESGGAQTEHSGTGCRLSSVWSWEMGTPIFHLLLTVIAFRLHLGINLRGVNSGSERETAGSAVIVWVI